jgi:hypothetical protein
MSHIAGYMVQSATEPNGVETVAREQYDLRVLCPTRFRRRSSSTPLEPSTRGTNDTRREQLVHDDTNVSRCVVVAPDHRVLRHHLGDESVAIRHHWRHRNAEGPALSHRP